MVLWLVNLLTQTCQIMIKTNIYPYDHTQEDGIHSVGYSIKCPNISSPALKINTKFKKINLKWTGYDIGKWNMAGWPGRDWMESRDQTSSKHFVFVYEITKE